MPVKFEIYRGGELKAVVKEALFTLGDHFIDRYRTISGEYYEETKTLLVRRYLAAFGVSSPARVDPERMRAADRWAIDHAKHAHAMDTETEEEATVKQCRQVLELLNGLDMPDAEQGTPN